MAIFKLRFLLILGLILNLTFGASNSFAISTEGSKMMISGPSPYAIRIGRDIAKRGGNVVDVAVGVGLTLAVTSPYYAALGGGGFALIKLGKEVEVLDFREVAPGLTGKDFYLEKAKDASLKGGTAVGVPGFPAGLWALHQKYGKLKWSQLFPAPMRLARGGFDVSGEWAQKTSSTKDKFDAGGKKHFFKADGTSYKPGETLKQPELYRALALFQKQNLRGFYSGPVADDLVAAVKASGGVLSHEDLKNYKVRWLKPLEVEFNKHKIYLMPPPSSGGLVLATALTLSEKMKLSETPPLSTNELHLMSEILSRSFRGRALLGDPDFAKNPIEFLLSEKYLTELAQSIDRKKAKSLSPLNEKKFVEKPETTHYSILDKDGNAVSLTVTLNENYGSGVVSPRYGIALNNEMDDFTTRPNEPNTYGLIQGQANLVEPGKRPLSSMSPTLVEKDGKIIMALGAPGGPRIITGVYHALYRSLISGWDMDQAIQAPRVHHQFLPNKVYVDKDRFSPEIIEGLKKRGHDVETGWQGKVYGVRLNANGILEAAFDSRGEGAAGGY